MEKVVETVKALVGDARLPPKECRNRSFNVFVGTRPSGSGLFRGCNILCPRSEKENLRVASRVREASKQLLSDNGTERPGILWLGLTRHQSAISLRDLLLRKFDAGQYSGISQAFLLDSGTHLEPPRRSVVDYGARIVNTRSRNVFSSEVPVKPLDLSGDAIALHAVRKGLSRYRVCAVESRYVPGMPQLLLPNFREINQESLR